LTTQSYVTPYFTEKVLGSQSSHDMPISIRGGDKSKPFDTINEFNLYWTFGRLTALKSVFADTNSYNLLSERCFKEIGGERRLRLVPLPGDLPDELEPFVPVCGVNICYDTSHLPGPSFQELFIVVKRLPLPEGVPEDCNISIIFTGQIRKKLEAIIRERLREAMEMDREDGGETRPNEKQGDVEDADHGDVPIRASGGK
jgi:hypothetical protein